MASSKTSLTDMPAELRLMIYDNISPPLTGHLTYALGGLMLSCRQLKDEVEHAVVFNMNKYLDEMKKEWTDTYGSVLVTSIPTTVKEVKNGVKVSIPHSYFRGHDRGFPRALLRLIPLHVDNITVNFHEDEAISDDGPPALKYPEVDRFNCDFQALLEKDLYLELARGGFYTGGRLGTDSLTLKSSLTDVAGYAMSLILPVFEDEESPEYWSSEDHKDALGRVIGYTWHRMVASPNKLEYNAYARNLPSRRGLHLRRV